MKYFQKDSFFFHRQTLSNNGDYSYIAKSLGIEKFLSLKVDSPFDYEENMKIIMHKNDPKNKSKEMINLLNERGGKSLILFDTKDSMVQFKKYINESNELNYPVIFEGDREISHLVEEFQKNDETILCSYHLWEGLDIPGSSLSNVLIANLPFFLLMILFLMPNVNQV